MEKKFTRLEAEYIAWQQAWAFTSVYENINEDFYEDFGSSQIIDKSKLNKDLIYFPSDEDRLLVAKEMKKVSKILHKKMMKIREKSGFKIEILKKTKKIK